MKGDGMKLILIELYVIVAIGALAGAVLFGSVVAMAICS